MWKPKADIRYVDSLIEIGRQALLGLACFVEVTSCLIHAIWVTYVPYPFSLEHSLVYSFSICRDWLGVALFLHRKAYVNKSKKYEVRERGKGLSWVQYSQSSSVMWNVSVLNYILMLCKVMKNPRCLDHSRRYGSWRNGTISVLPFEGIHSRGKPHHLVFIDQDGLALAIPFFWA